MNGKQRLSYQELEARLSAAEETLAALRRGEVDLLIGEAAAYVLRIRELEEELEATAHQWQAVFDSVGDSVMLLDENNRIQRCNRATTVILGRDESNIVGRPCWDLVCGAHGLPAEDCPLKKMRESGKRENALLEKDGRWLQVTADPLRNADGELVGAVHLISDVTQQQEMVREQEKLEAQLRQVQKMESIGQLAGGIAHDFNNLLVPILGYAEMGMMRISPDHELYEHFSKIKNSADRAASLTRQILAFSRKQILDMRPVNLNTIVQEFEDMLLRRLIGENIILQTVLADNLSTIEADRSQLEQILLNLAVNARDAMPTGGKLVIETENVTLDDAYVLRHPGAAAGPHVMLAVTDTGCGMDAETRDRVFEPFFTTKDREHGTGLGLSTVFGIVKQHGGNIWVYSEPGHGSTFRVYFPAATGAAGVEEVGRSAGDAPAGTETILVVEDEAAVRSLVVETLQAHGYQVLEAATPQAGLELAATHGRPIDLLLTDIVMPEMNGRQLYEQIMGKTGPLKVLYMSGYTDNVIVHHGILGKGVDFLQKPFSINRLLQKVRAVLANGR